MQMQERPCPAAPQPDRPPGHDRRQETRRDSKSHRSRNRSCPVVPLVEFAAGDLRRAGEHSIAGREQGGQRVVRARGRRDARIGGPRRGYGHDRREQECREPVHQETLRDALASHLCLSVLFLIPLSTQDPFSPSRELAGEPCGGASQSKSRCRGRSLYSPQDLRGPPELGNRQVVPNRPPHRPASEGRKPGRFSLARSSERAPSR